MGVPSPIRRACLFPMAGVLAMVLAATPALLPAASSKTKVEIRGNQFFLKTHSN